MPSIAPRGARVVWARHVRWNVVASVGGVAVAAVAVVGDGGAADEVIAGQQLASQVGMGQVARVEHRHHHACAAARAVPRVRQVGAPEGGARAHHVGLCRGEFRIVGQRVVQVQPAIGHCFGNARVLPQLRCQCLRVRRDAVGGAEQLQIAGHAAPHGKVHAGLAAQALQAVFRRWSGRFATGHRAGSGVCRGSAWRDAGITPTDNDIARIGWRSPDASAARAAGACATQYRHARTAAHRAAPARPTRKTGCDGCGMNTSR